MSEQEILGCYCDLIHMTCSVCRDRTRKTRPAFGLNIYRHSFVASCPNDGEMIVYKLEIRSTRMIMVEHIKTATALIKSGHQERIADDLAERFGAHLILIGTHQGVELTSIRLPE